ncbi:MAG: dynamin family protein [Phycisphaerales bacterium]|nr:dynamin family protein [Hyphomonadaceae bacterium]
MFDWLQRALGPKAPRGPIVSRRGNAVIEAIDALLKSAPAEFPSELRSELDLARRKLKRADVRIAFGGLFKAGKSTLLNAVIGRDLLPSNDLAETGAPTQIRAGPTTTVHVCRANGSRQPIEATKAGIGAQASIRHPDGRRRVKAELPILVDIALQSFPFPSHLSLFDVPGLNDKEEISQTATHVLMNSDFIFWVFRTDPEFSEQDVAAIARISVHFSLRQFTFVLNARLSADDANHWRKFRKTRIRPASEKVSEYMEAMGFKANAKPPLSVVSARALRRTRSEFGGKQLHRVVASIAARTNEEIIDLRLPSARTPLQASLEWAKRRVSECKSAFDASAARHAAYVHAKQKREDLEKHLAEAVRQTFALMSRELSGLGDRHADRISTSAYSSGIAYGPSLAADASAIVIRAARKMYAECERRGRELGLEASTDNRNVVFGGFSLLGGDDPDCDGSISRGIAKWTGNLYSPSVEKNFVETIEGWFGDTSPRDRTAAGFRGDVRACGNRLVDALVGRESGVLQMVRQCFRLPNPAPAPPADPKPLHAAEAFHRSVADALALCY